MVWGEECGGKDYANLPMCKPVVIVSYNKWGRWNINHLIGSDFNVANWFWRGIGLKMQHDM